MPARQPSSVRGSVIFSTVREWARQSVPEYLCTPARLVTVVEKGRQLADSCEPCAAFNVPEEPVRTLTHSPGGRSPALPPSPCQSAMRAAWPILAASE